VDDTEPSRLSFEKISAERAALIVGVILLVVYIMSLAPTVTYWDAGEFQSAIKTLGIPHPPGTPLYILIGNVWAKILSPAISFAASVNLLSAVCTAVACGLFAWLTMKWTGDPVAAIAGGILAGVMSSVWLNANETEVYSPSLLISILLLIVAYHADRSREPRFLILLAYLVGLGWSLQLSSLVSLPAALFLAFRDYRGRKIPWLAMILAAILGASATLFMIVRAQHDPAINQGNPATWNAFVDVITRKQYLPVSILPRQAPWYLQIGNFFEYADWQVALGLHPDPPPALLRTSFSVVYAILGVIGCVWHRRANRRSWEVMMLLLLTATLGVIAYLNMKASPSYGYGFLPGNAKHEARERDYFFALGFACWGMWAGAGAVRLISRVTYRELGIVFALLPMLLNWTAVDRSQCPRSLEPIYNARKILDSAPPRAVVFAHGDNDTYPVWYAQQVESHRRDVVNVTIPLLGARWYREELARRYSLIDYAYVATWHEAAATIANICRRARLVSRPIVIRAGSAIGEVPDDCQIQPTH
jgi:hypothetical protein